MAGLRSQFAKVRNFVDYRNRKKLSNIIVFKEIDLVAELPYRDVGNGPIAGLYALKRIMTCSRLRDQKTE